MKMKLLIITLGSVLLTSLVLTSAFYQKKQFYPSVIYITKSSISMAAIYLQAFVFVILISKLLGKIFFGQLRPAEIEHLVERMWYAITETCLAFTVFREDFSPKFVAMFTILLFFKCFHWLAEDRVDFMERSPVIPFKFHVRMIGLLSLLSVVDYIFILYAYRYTIEKGPTAQLVFGFEYTILKLSLIVIFFRYVLHTIDSRRETPWDQKATFMLYIDLISNFLKLVFYVMFLVLMIKVHTLPLFIIRPVYLSMRSFKKTVQDLVLSRRAIHYMNTVFTTATQEELAANDNICIICREEMVAPNTPQSSTNPQVSSAQTTTSLPKCLPCGHIFHCSCLKTWFQRQQTCPTCRMDILRNVQQTQRSNNRRSTQPQGANSSGTNAAATNPTTTPNPTAPNLANQPPPFMPGMMPPFPTPFPWMMPPPNAAAGTNNTATTDQTQKSPADGLPNMMMSPMMPFASFMMPGMPMFSSPMPEMTSADLAKLKDEDLEKLEKQGREGMEFRVQTLQQIHVLLDAAVLLMNAYMVSIRNINNENKMSAGAATDVQENAKGDKPADESSKEDIKTETNIETESETPKEDVCQSGATNNVEENKDDNKQDDEINKIRDLRLRKFLTPQTSQEVTNENEQ